MTTTTWLFAYQGGAPVAYSHDGRNFFTANGGKPFAWRSEDRLHEYSGSPIGWFQGANFFQHPGGRPLYYARGT